MAETDNKDKELDLVGTTEAAEILGWHKQQITEYLKRGQFPAPAAVVARTGRVWHRQQILDFKEQFEARRRGRGSKPDETEDR